MKPKEYDLRKIIKKIIKKAAEQQWEKKLIAIMTTKEVLRWKR